MKLKLFAEVYGLLLELFNEKYFLMPEEILSLVGNFGCQKVF